MGKQARKLVYCDNAATVAAMNSGRAQDPLIRGALREAWWLTAVWDVELTIRHRPGAEMQEADLLSWAGMSESFKTKFEDYVNSSPDCMLDVGAHMLLPPLPIWFRSVWGCCEEEDFGVQTGHSTQF